MVRQKMMALFANFELMFWMLTPKTPVYPQDVIALRKTNGAVLGDVRLNGFSQDPISFRRIAGYVEQVHFRDAKLIVFIHPLYLIQFLCHLPLLKFDVQSPELTVRETLLFSARLRLDSSHDESDELKRLFVDQVMRMLELHDFADSLIGSNEGGLSFEQRKRVSIAVEMCASPSALFLDEVR